MNSRLVALAIAMMVAFIGLAHSQDGKTFPYKLGGLELQFPSKPTEGKSTIETPDGDAVIHTAVLVSSDANIYSLQVTTYPKAIGQDLDAYLKDQLPLVKSAKKVKSGGLNWVEVLSETKIDGKVTAARSRVTFDGKVMWNISVGGTPDFVNGKQADAFFASAKVAPKKG